MARKSESITFRLGSKGLTERFIARYQRLGLSRTELIRILVHNEMAEALQTTENNPKPKNEQQQQP